MGFAKDWSCVKPIGRPSAQFRLATCSFSGHSGLCAGPVEPPALAFRRSSGQSPFFLGPTLWPDTSRSDVDYPELGKESRRLSLQSRDTPGAARPLGSLSGPKRGFPMRWFHLVPLERAQRPHPHRSGVVGLSLGFGHFPGFEVIDRIFSLHLSIQCLAGRDGCFRTNISPGEGREKVAKQGQE